MPRRRKTEIGVFRHNPTEIPRNNRFTNARKTGILYHVLAPVAQLDRALDSDSKGHAFESHRAYQNVLMKDATPKTPHESAAFSHIMRHF